MRCRVNVFHTLDRIAVALRLLASVEPTVEQLNLHPDLKMLAQSPHGLVLVSGPRGSGKSSTLAALIREINANRERHIVTVEEPVEYLFRSRSSFVAQREVGRDTPSFEQALLDVLREDPDVVMVGEMRHPEVMRLTLNVAETGHLMYATVHSANCTEALTGAHHGMWSFERYREWIDHNRRWFRFEESLATSSSKEKAPKSART